MYLIVCIAVFSEASTLIGLIVPGETLLLAGGVAAAIGPTSIGGLIAASCVSAVAGDTCGYVIGRRWGRRVMFSPIGRRIGQRRWIAARAQLRNGGFAAVVIARWIGYVRTLTPFAAGMLSMPTRRYLAANLVGGVAWVTTVGLLGYAAGALVGARILLYGAGIALLAVIAGVVATWLLRLRRSHRQRPKPS